ncbi:hypothetical protein ACHAXT_008863 [Thalassiosira profunda]
MTAANDGPDAARDAALARQLQERYWSLGGSSGAAPPSANARGGSGGRRPSPSPPPRTNGDLRAPSSTQTAPRHKKGQSGGDPVTVAGRMAYLEERQLRKEERRGRSSREGTPKGSPRSSPRSSPARSSRASSSRSSPRTSPQGSPRTSPRTSPRGSPRHSPRNSASGSMFVDTSKDEDLARKLNQELRDAELASSLARAERGKLPRSNTQSTSRSTSRGDSFVESPSRLQTKKSSKDGGPPGDCKGKAIYYGWRIGLAIVLAGLTFFIYITVFGARHSDDLDPASWVPGYPEMDPSLGSVGEHNRWKPVDGQPKGQGLTLTVLNNLKSGSDWNGHLEASLAEWDDGRPDGVTLNVRTMQYDPDCRAVRRAMKVCNANYGPTDWRGVNQILLQDEYIITSLAKMNDYYLEGTNKAQKRYTMCHELGHGLGLGHSDENFHNRDLGNCMDYTERPQNNMSPDKSNFESLVELYGRVDGGVWTESTNVRVERSGYGGGRQLTGEEFERYAGFLLERVEVSSIVENKGWRLLKRTEFAEVHERRLGNGYSMRATVLLA